ncbi:hypothetical protein BJ742DRAFT_825172, partial [Cladochytrium replicatum]
MRVNSPAPNVDASAPSPADLPPLLLDDDEDAAPANHLLIITHGMGNSYHQFEKYVQLTRHNMKEALKDEFHNSPDLSVEVIGVEWYQVLHQLETVDARMRTITLPTCASFRSVNNETLADVLYYFTRFHGQEIISIVTKLFNSAYDRFRERNPNANGKVAIMAHSLGGIIAYDIIANQPRPFTEQPDSFISAKAITGVDYPILDFQPSFLFTLGSPFSAVLVMRGQDYNTYKLPSNCRYHNIFNVFDPLSYRTEPLIDPRYREVAPVMMTQPRSFPGPSSFYQTLLNIAPARSVSLRSVLPSIPRPNFAVPTWDAAFQAISGMLDAVFYLPTTVVSLVGNGDGVTNDARDEELEERPRKRPKIEGWNEPDESEMAENPLIAELTAFDTVENTDFAKMTNFEPLYSQNCDSTPSRKRRASSPDSLPVSEVTGPSGTSPTHVDDSDDLQPDTTAAGLYSLLPSSMVEMASRLARSVVDPMIRRMSGVQSHDEVHDGLDGWDQANHDDLDDVVKDGGVNLVNHERRTDGDSKVREEPEPPEERLDYCIEDAVTYNVMHQYLLGLRAHFTYWHKKEIISHVIKQLN